VFDFERRIFPTLLKVSSKKASRNYNFGYSRIEIIIAIFNVLFIWILTGALVAEAVNRIKYPDEFELDGKIMLIVSSLAVFFNMTLVLQN
jgi:zinc transporter 2